MGIKNNGHINEVLYRLNVNSDIEPELLEKAFNQVLINTDSKTRDVQMGSILTGLMGRGPNVDQISALLRTIFSFDGFDYNNKVKIDLPNNEKLICSVGSGKKGYKTMNISTPALLIAATYGIYCAKPASSSTSSVTGSSDFLNEVGVNMDLNIKEMGEVIKKTRFGVFSIENLLPKFDNIYGGRFYVPHTLSFGLAALASPVIFDHILYGLAHPNVELSADVLRKFNVENALVVSSSYDGIHYIDEIGINGTSKIVGIKDGKKGDVKNFNPHDYLDIPLYSVEDISQGKTVQQNVQYVIDVLRGVGKQAHEDIICINTGSVMYLAGKVETFVEGYHIAKKIIKTGAPLEKLIEVVHATNGDKMLKRYL